MIAAESFVTSGRTLLDGEFRSARVHIRDARAAGIEVLDDSRAAADGPIVAPAPLDLHLHGGGGAALPPAGDAALVAKTHAPGEFVAALPAWTTQAPTDLAGHVEAAALTLRSCERCVGLRLEGVFLNPVRAGAWPPETLRNPDIDLFSRMHSAARDAGCPVRIVDVAPDLPDAPELTAAIVEAGCIAAVAHSNATYEQTCAVIDAGATLATHTWNAMRPLHHRDPGIVAAVLNDPRVTCEVIADGVHLHPAIVELTARAAQGGVAVISDASPLAGLAAGATTSWLGRTLHTDGTSVRDERGNLAGSAVTLSQCLDLLLAWGMSPLSAIAAITAAPRAVLEPRRPCGLQIGDPVWLLDDLPVHSAHA